jgi:APA family basic amino acid/polyamine antiporter
MPIGELAAVRGSLLDVIGERLLGVRAGDILGVVAIVSVAAGINAWTFAGPRVYYAMARDGVFFPAASRVHPRFKTPHVSITAQALWASVLILSGSLDSLANYVGFAITLFAGIAVAAVFVLRAREPEAPRPYKTLGYPIAPAIFVLASLAIVLNAVYRNPGPSGVGLLVILSGIPLYMWLTRRKPVS